MITRLYENRPIGDNMPSLNLSGIVTKASEQQPRVRQRALPLKLSTAVSLMIGSVIGAVLLLVYALWYMQISNATRDGLKETALAVARAPWPICRR
ncbi:hypothetical protein LNO36_13885 [Klebsiella variicola subsp. variicola]|nr:hypothetical protein [Klebsiella variicola subsp. variicola]